MYWQNTLITWANPINVCSASFNAMSDAVLLECQLLAMQFVFIKPITAIVTFVLHLMNKINGGQGVDEADTPAWKFLLTAKFWVVMVQNVSVFFAFAGLLKFYHAVWDDLLWCQPFSKFLCFKGVVFMTFWQGLLIAIFINFDPKAAGGGEEVTEDEDRGRNMAILVQNIIICLAMLFFSLAHFCVFPADEWEEGYLPKQMEKPGMAFQDFAKDVNLVFDHTTRGVRASHGSARQRQNITDSEACCPDQSTELLADSQE
jgi:hypothetical protein